MWGLLEAAMQDAIWRILNVPMEDGRILTGRTDASTKLQWLRSLSKRHIRGELFEQLQLVLKTIEDRMDDRNFIVHGVWGTMTFKEYGHGDVPMALSLRRKSLPHEVASETFPNERMTEIIADVAGAKADLKAWMELLSASRKKSPPPLPGAE
jgi:hypothetical protein